MWTPEVDLSIDEARSIIEAQFSELAPARVERIGAGMDNAGFRVNDSLVFRFPRRTVAVPLIEREIRVLPWIAGTLPLPIPVPRYTGAPSDAYPWPFEGHSYLEGTTACSIEITEEQRSEFAPALGAFLRALHAVDLREARERGLAGDEIGRFNHARRLPLATERLLKLHHLGAIDDPRPLLAAMRAIAPNDSDDRVVVAHGDLYARHLLVDADHRLCGVIDWGDVHIGHPGVDLAIVYTMLPIDAHAGFFEHYGSVNDRTLELALYRAIYHSALVAEFGHEIGDRALMRAGTDGLRNVRGLLDAGPRVNSSNRAGTDE
jgi:aminoglycoside phosphotransferase (APT) family kinase protein